MLGVSTTPARCITCFNSPERADAIVSREAEKPMRKQTQKKIGEYKKSDIFRYNC